MNIIVLAIVVGLLVGGLHARFGIEPPLPKSWERKRQQRGRRQ